MQKTIKKIAFLENIAKMVSLRPNHKIFSGFVAWSEKKHTKILRKDQICAISIKVPFQPTLMDIIHYKNLPANKCFGSQKKLDEHENFSKK
jgi:hypothetical protein